MGSFFNIELMNNVNCYLFRKFTCALTLYLLGNCKNKYYCSLYNLNKDFSNKFYGYFA